jgi:hypothetical protein
LKSGWELKFEDNHWAANLSGVTVLLISAFVYAFFSQADASFATAFSRTFSLEVDLGQCSSSFASLIMSQIAFALVICLILLGLTVALGAAAIGDAENRMRYLKLLLATLAFLLILLALAMKDDGFWLSSTGRRSFGRHLSIVDACAQSHNTDFVRIYVMSAWLGLASWMLIWMDILKFRAIFLHRNYNDLPKNPELRAEILAIRAKYGDVYQPTRKPQMTLPMIALAGFLFIIVVHGLYKLAVALGAL